MWKSRLSYIAAMALAAVGLRSVPVTPTFARRDPHAPEYRARRRRVSYEDHVRARMRQNGKVM
jgi:hypothetical protein